MKVCIVGAGAIGGLIGARLAATGRAEISAIARGATLAALRAHGWRLRQSAGLLQVPARASDRTDDLGPQDLVIVAVKGTALAAVAPALAGLMGPDTLVMPAMNGVPWWLTHGTAAAAPPLQCVDPGGLIASQLPIERVLGCVVHASATCPEPGVVQHVMGDGLIIGEATGGASARSAAVGRLLDHAGFNVTVSADIRRDIWFKLWGNLTMNPVSALTGATIDRLLADPLVREFCSAAMQEAASIGDCIGIPAAQTPEQRHDVTAKLGAFKTSMLQDAEAGRALELDAIVGAVREIGQRLDIPTPNIDALFGLSRLFAQVRGLYPASPP